MGLEKRVYSVLVVSAAESFNSALASLLPESEYDPIQTVSALSAAKRATAQRDYDLILINSPLPDDAGIRFAIDLCATRSTVVLLLIKNDIHDEIYAKVAQHGVFTLPKPTSRASMLRALSWMASARERLRRFEKKTLSIEEKMEEIRIVNRAKWLLIRALSMNEEDAHRYIEKQAMDRCVSKKTIAEEIVKTYA